MIPLFALLPLVAADFPVPSVSPTFFTSCDGLEGVTFSLSFLCCPFTLGDRLTA